MCLLSDITIAEFVQDGKLKIEPFEPDNVQPNSIDVRLASQIRETRKLHQAYIDIKTDDIGQFTEVIEIDTQKGFIIHPGDFILGSTIERFELPDNLAAHVEGRSSLGRLGLIIHSTAGFVDAGFQGHITLEISNISTLPIKIYPHMKIAQIAFEKLTTPAARPYGSHGLGSKYQHQVGPSVSKIQLDYQTRR